jgi:hypothetical protein
MHIMFFRKRGTARGADVRDAITFAGVKQPKSKSLDQPVPGFAAIDPLARLKELVSAAYRWALPEGEGDGRGEEGRGGGRTEGRQGEGNGEIGGRRRGLNNRRFT